MAIRIRKVDGCLVALCAAETKKQKGDIYLDDNLHQVLGEKFYADHVKMGFIKKEGDDLVEKLKLFMAEKDLTITDVASLTKKDYKTIWQFLLRKVKPHDRTVYRIKKLIEGGVNEYS